MLTYLFENDRNYLLGDPELEIIGDRDKLAQWRHKMKGPAFYRLGRKIIYRGSDLNAWVAANRVDPSQNAGGEKMSKKTREPREGLDLFSVAGRSEYTSRRGDKLKSPPPMAKPNRMKQKKATFAASVEEAPNERYLPDTAVAHRYGVCRQTVWRWAAQGTLPEAVKLSFGVTRWRLSDLLAHEASLPKGGKGQVVRPSCVKTAKPGGSS